MNPSSRKIRREDDFEDPLEDLAEKLRILGESCVFLQGFESSTPISMILEILTDIGILVQQFSWTDRQWSSDNPSVIFPKGKSLKSHNIVTPEGTDSFESSMEVDNLKYPTDALGNPLSIKVRKPKIAFDLSKINDFGIFITEQSQNLLLNNSLAFPFVPESHEKKKSSGPLSASSYWFWRRRRAAKKKQKI